jgi:hypothetical protein
VKEAKIFSEFIQKFVGIFLVNVNFVTWSVFKIHYCKSSTIRQTKKVRLWCSPIILEIMEIQWIICPQETK